MEQVVEDIFELDELLEANDTQFDTVKAYGKTVRIGSLSSADMIEWLEGNDQPETKRFAGINLLVKSVVNSSGVRIPEDQRAEAIEKFKRKDARSNGRVIAAILRLNGMNASRAKAQDELKNVSSEATTAASPSGLPLKLVE
jgi:hypothetical protein